MYWSVEFILSGVSVVSANDIKNRSKITTSGYTGFGVYTHTNTIYMHKETVKKQMNSWAYPYIYIPIKCT